MSGADLTLLPDDTLARVLEHAETSLAQCEPLKWKSDAGVMLWLEARTLVRALSAELQRRVSAELAELDGGG